MSAHRLSLLIMAVMSALVLVSSGLVFADNGLGPAVSGSSQITFEIGHGLTFIVEDESGTPLTGAMVQVDGLQEATDADGHAEFILQPGTYDYTVSKDGYASVVGVVGIVDEDVTVEVTLLLKTYTLDVYKVDEGTVRVDGAPVTFPFSETYEHGTQVDLHAIPDAPAWAFDEWRVNDVIHPVPSITVTMVGDRTATAYFREVPSPPPPPPPPDPDEYTVIIEQIGEGTVDPEPGEYTYEEGTELTIRARPDAPDYIFGYWMVDDEMMDVGPPPVTIDIAVNRDLTVTAVFVEPPAPPPGEFEIWVPPLAGPETLEIGVTTREAEPEICQPRGPVDGLVFEVTAYLFSDDEESVELSKFDEPVTVTLHWDEELDTEDAERILIHYYHEALEMWIPLPTQVDVANQQATAQIDRPADLVMCVKDKFTDIDGHWGEKYILFLSEVGPIDGYLDMTFRPDELVTREQFAKMLVESAGLSPQFARRIDFLFTDARDISDWARSYVETALLDRLVLGFEDDTFRSHAVVTRAQVATMISRSLGLAPVGQPPFVDAVNLPDWAAGHVAALSHLDIVMGLPGNLFLPHRQTTRAEAAAFLSRYLDVRLGR